MYVVKMIGGFASIEVNSTSMGYYVYRSSSIGIYDSVWRSHALVDRFTNHT